MRPSYFIIHLDWCYRPLRICSFFQPLVSFPFNSLNVLHQINFPALKSSIISYYIPNKVQIVILSLFIDILSTLQCLSQMWPYLQTCYHPPNGRTLIFLWTLTSFQFPDPQLLVTITILSFSMSLALLDSTYKRCHTIFVCLCLANLTKHNILKVHSYCKWQKSLFLLAK